MGSIFERLWEIGPAAIVVKAIVAAVIADGLLLGFILIRRMYRKRYFARRDAQAVEIRKNWEDLLSGKIAYEKWRSNRFYRRIVERMALDTFDTAGPEESARLLKFLRASGLIEKLIFEARNLKGWRRMRALVALGRTRAPEGIPALAEGLRDREVETRLAALRGLGRTADPQAAEEILAWVEERGMCVPALPLQSALAQCCAERPQMLLRSVQYAEGAVREVLGRVLGEIAGPALGSDLLQFVEDKVDELRAAAARGLSHTKTELAFDVLNELTRDPVWFVRLRAIVSLGQLGNRRAIPALLRGITDANRLVRLRAAEALVNLRTDRARVFQQVVGTRDRYALHAFLTALENANLQNDLENEIQCSPRFDVEEKQRLRGVLASCALAADGPQTAERVLTGAERQP